MKKTKLVVAALASMLLVSSLTACGGGSKPEEPVPFSFSAQLGENGYKSLFLGDSATIEIKEFEASEVELDPETGEPVEVQHSYTFTSSDTNVLTVSEEGVVTAAGVGDAKIKIIENIEGVERNLAISVYDQANLDGAISYKTADSATKQEILGRLEKYAMDEHLTGVSLFENGGYVMYNPRVQKGTETYITGYGFGIAREGQITEDLPSESKAEWKKYYHTATSTDPANINALDAKGTDVSDLYDYISSSYFGVKMNAKKDGYDWYGVLSKEDRPIATDSLDGEPLADQANAVSSFWKFHVRTGADEHPLEFRTLSTKSGISSFDHRPVTLDDYKYGLQALLTGKFGLYRGNELAAQTKYGFAGAKKYFDATKESEGSDDAKFAENVKFVTGTDDGGAYIAFQSADKLSRFECMYGLSSSLYQPLCKDFIVALGGGSEVKGAEALGMKKYGSYPDGSSPVDTILSLGQFNLEYWEQDKTIAFKKNDTWFESVENTNINRIPGYKIAIYRGAAKDETLVIKEFLAGKLDSASIPNTSYLKKYRDDPRTTTTTGDAVFKLNMNSCTEEQWEELFGQEGSISPTSSRGDYWDVKPWMSNKNFLNGLNCAIDRLTFATNRGRIPSNNYYSSNYMIDPEGGLAWNATEWHEWAMQDYFYETSGYNLAAAKMFFKQAVEELVADEKLELGTKKKPTKITIETWWMDTSDAKSYGNEIGKYIQDAFNSSYVCEGKVKLKVVNKAVTDAMDVYYKHLMVGQFDLGFGSVSGNSLDPINFLEVLLSDNRSGFTLNWGPDTSKVSDDLIFDGRRWSFASLWCATDSYVYCENGVETPLFDVKDAKSERKADGSFVVTLELKETNNALARATLEGICVYATTDTNTYADYTEIYILKDGTEAWDVEGADPLEEQSGKSSWVYDSETGLTTITFSPEVMAILAALEAEDDPETTDKDETKTICSFGCDLYTYEKVDSLGIDVFGYKVSVCTAKAFPAIPKETPEAE